MLIERTGRVTGVITSSREQVTNASDLLALNSHYLDRELGQVRCDSPLPSSARLIPPVVIEAGVEIGPGTVIGPRVYIEQDVQIGAGARLSDTLVLRGAEVMAGQHVSSEFVAPLSAFAPKPN
jgi:NDP-sugar pyrophosphorylase family protein